MTRNSGRMPSSRKRKRPSGPQERCQRSASSQSSSDDNRSGGRGCGRVIATFSATTSKGQLHQIPQAAIAIASHMASDLRPEHKLPSKDVLVTPNPEFMRILRTVGAEKSIFTAREVLSFLIKYIGSRQLYDKDDPKKVYCKDDPLGKVFNVDMFTIKEAKKLLFDNLTVINKGVTLPGLTGEISDDKKGYFTLVQRQFNEAFTRPPSTVTEPMDVADGNGVKPAAPVSKRNPLVPLGLDHPASTLPIVEEVAPVIAPSAPNPLCSSTSVPVVMDTVDDVTKATANVANLFRSVSLDVDPCQEGPSTASTRVMDCPAQQHNKPDGKRTAKTRQSSDSSDCKPKTPSKSPPSQSDVSESASARQWVRLHYRPGEDTKSLSSERLSVQDYDTVVVADSSDDLWFVEQEVSEFEIEYSVGDSSEGFASNGSADDSSSETEMVFEVAADDSSDSRWADDSSSTDTEISEQDKWDCFECQARNPPVDRYCNRCWCLRKGWLPDDEQRMTLRERLLNQAKELRRTNSAPAGHITGPLLKHHFQLTKDNLERHNLTCHEEKTDADAMETMDTFEACQAPIIRPGCSSTEQAHYQLETNNNHLYPSGHCAAAGGGCATQPPPQATLPPPQFCDSGHLMALGNRPGPYKSGLEDVPDDPEGIGDEGSLYPYPPAAEDQGQDFFDGNEDKEKPVGRQVKTGEENGNGASGGAQGGPPDPQSYGGPGFPGGGFSTGQGGVKNGSPRQTFGQSSFGQPSFGQSTFGHKSVVNNSPPGDTGPRIFGQDLDGYSPSTGPKPGGILHQGHFRRSLSMTSNDSQHATCSANTLSPESELEDDKTAHSFNLVENDPIARKRMKMDTQRQDSGIGLSQEMSEQSKASMDAQLCNDNYVQTHGDPPPLARRRHSSASELESGPIGGQDSTIQSGRGNHPGAIQKAFDSAAPSTSQEGQTRVPDICGFCFKRPKNASIIHGKTGHQVCCYQCAKKLRRRGKPCPICRQSIQAVIKNFLV